MTWIIKHTVHYATNLYLMKNGRQCTVIHPLQCCRVVGDNLPYTQRKGTPQHPKFAKNWGKIETRNSVKPVKQTPKYMYVLGCLSFYPQFCFAFFSLFWPNFYKASQILKKILKKHCEPPRCPNVLFIAIVRARNCSWWEKDSPLGHWARQQLPLPFSNCCHLAVRQLREEWWLEYF